MKTKDQIKVLLENGIRANTISKMNENQIKVLAKKFTLSEQATPQNTTPETTTTTKYVVKPNSKTMVYKRFATKLNFYFFEYFSLSTINAPTKIS
jgi:hypothetical protein